MSTATAKIGLALDSSKPPCQAAEESITPRAARFSLVAAIRPQTPDPSTPELCWDDTPALSILGTPEDESDSDGGVSLAISSPSIVRKNRAKLRSAGLDVTPSKLLRDTFACAYEPPLSTRSTVLIKNFDSTERPKTASLELEENEHKFKDNHEDPLPEQNPDPVQISEHLSPRIISADHESPAQLQEKDLAPPFEVGCDLEEVIAPADQCDGIVASLGVFDESTSAVVDKLGSPTATVDPSTINIDGSGLSQDPGHHLRITVTWTPSATLFRLLPVDVIERLRACPIYCIATTKKDPKKRCGNKNAAKLTEDNVNILLKDLLEPMLLSNFSSIAKIVEGLAIQATCKHQHQKLIKSEFAALRAYAEQEGSHTAIKGKEKDIVTVDNYAAFYRWLLGLSKSPIHVQPRVKVEVKSNDRIPATPPMTKPDRVLDDDTPVKCRRFEVAKVRNSRQAGGVLEGSESPFAINMNWVERSRRKPPTLSPKSSQLDGLSIHLSYKFEPFTLSGKQQNMTPAALICYHLTRPLAPKDSTAEGYIYVYWNPGNFGYLKIGHTKHSNTDKRLNAWQSKCKVDARQITDPHKAVQFSVRHPLRVENLIHAELNRYRLQFRCPSPKCRAMHGEWFKVESTLAQQVIRKWSELLLYENGKLSQKFTTEEKLEELCKVTTLEMIAVHPQSRSSRRKPLRSSIGK